MNTINYDLPVIVINTSPLLVIRTSRLRIHLKKANAVKQVLRRNPWIILNSSVKRVYQRMYT